MASSPFRTTQHEFLQIVGRDRRAPYSEIERDYIVARVLAGIEGPDEHGTLEDLYTRWQILLRLGRSDPHGRTSDAIGGTLMACWAQSSDGNESCFAPGSKSLKPSSRVSAPLGRLSLVWLPATDHGLRLMAEFGVPKGIDPVLLHNYLERMGRSRGFTYMRGYEARAAAMRYRLEFLPEWAQVPAAPLLPELLGYRLILTGLASRCFASS